MPYPRSPFSDDFRAEFLFRTDTDDNAAVNEIRKPAKMMEWLCETPRMTSFRVNTLKSEPETVLELVRNQVVNAVKVEQHPHCEDAIIIHHYQKINATLNIHEKEVVVDTVCAAAVLRGAHIYAPGVMAMMTGCQTGDKVSVFADVAKKCKKGLQKSYDKDKIFIGNGIVKMVRHQLFYDDQKAPPPVGVAVQMTETISNCPPSLGDDFLPMGFALLQNLPSIVCVHLLDPQPNDVVLDMCASPGNKTTHIAALMKNTGKLTAVDKTPSKVAQLKQRCEHFGARVEIVQADSTKLIQENRFLPESFDKILLDAPCSALGKRPQLLNTTSMKVIRSYIPLQRKLFENAVQLLKNKGTLVYSTCTITLAENEGIVAWALKNFPLDLVQACPHLGGPGLGGTTLTEDDLQKVQRFGPGQEIDSVGFFIAKFIKRF